MIRPLIFALTVLASTAPAQTLPESYYTQGIAPNGAYAIFEAGPTLNHILIVERGYCSDGMSDREFGWRGTLFNEAPDGNSVQHGCCTLDTNF